MRFSQQNSRRPEAHSRIQRRRSDSLHTRSLSSAAQSGPHPIIQDPGFRFAPPWAEVYYAFGVFPRCYLLKNALIAEYFFTQTGAASLFKSLQPCKRILQVRCFLLHMPFCPAIKPINYAKIWPHIPLAHGFVAGDIRRKPPGNA